MSTSPTGPTRESAFAQLSGRACGATDELLDARLVRRPEQLRPAAAVTLAAHLDKLEQEGALPGGVERPSSTFESGSRER